MITHRTILIARLSAMHAELCNYFGDASDEQLIEYLMTASRALQKAGERVANIQLIEETEAEKSA